MDFQKQIEAITRQLSDEAKREKEAQIVRQVEQGKCDLIPFPTVATQPFRSELTVEGMPLFVVNAFKGDSWQYERNLRHPQSGEPVRQRVSVGKLHPKDRPRGVLKQIHQEVFYKLLKLWGDREHPIMEYTLERKKTIVGCLTLTAYELVTCLRGDDSAGHYRRVQELLQDLASIPVTREETYEWQDTTSRMQFTLLAGATWIERNVDSRTRKPESGGTSSVTILFSPVITEGFIHGTVKQLLLAPYESFGRGGEVARLLYSLLDHELSTKDTFHITLRNLSERLGLANYAHKSQRRRRFSAAVKQLNRQPILGERHHLDVLLRPTADGTDYVLEARRDSAQLRLNGV